MSAFPSKLGFLLLGLFLIVAAANDAGATGRRVALVIGNANYEKLPKLSDTINDANAVSDSLEAAGFQVYLGSDLDRRAFSDLIQRFYRGVDGAEIALIYYSGHGVQIAGSNYLLPVDAKLETPYDIEQQTLNVDDIFQYISGHSQAQLIFLDSCRNNPFNSHKFWVADKLQEVGENSEGLARVTTSMGSLIAFSTTPGKVAYDGTTGLSPYTAAFVKYVPIPNQEIRQALTQVRRDVIAATGGRQVPWENSSLVSDIYLAVTPPPPSVAPMQQVTVQAGGPAVSLDLSKPTQERETPLTVSLDALPKQGRITLDGVPIDAPRSFSAADFNRLRFDPAGVGHGVVDLLSFTVSDPWRQSARGVIVITVGDGPDPAVKQAELDQQKQRADAAAAYLGSIGGRSAKITIGVGPIPLGLPAMSPPPTEGSPLVEVISVPDLGALKLGARVLTAGSRLRLGDLSLLSFEPKVGTEDHTGTVKWKVDGIANPGSVTITPVLDPCDMQAAAPLDLQGVTAGMLPNDIHVDAALKACGDALARYPGSPRFTFELARAEIAAGLSKEAQKHLLAAADMKYLQALAALGTLEKYGAFGTPDMVKADAYFAACAEGGDPLCLYSHGVDLFEGRGVTKDVPKGLMLILRAAELGQTYAMNFLGRSFIDGHGVDKDVERGIRYYEAGAAHRDIYSFNNLGLIYLSGAGRQKDLQAALDYFTRAAEGGQPYAPANLGRMYRDGVGVPVDRAKAAQWLESGALRGDYWSAVDRSRLYADASGKPTDASDAAIWLGLAASLNFGQGNLDRDNIAAKELKALPSVAKKTAAANLSAKLGPDARKIHAAQIDDRIVQLSRELWLRGRPRYDLF